MAVDCTFDNKLIGKQRKKRRRSNNLATAEVDKTYTVKEVKTSDLEMKDFLFTLGCYEGEKVTVISKLSGNYVINIKDARYSIDKNLAKVILV